MSESRLDICHDKIVSRTGLQSPYDLHFKGDVSDQNLFARIVRGDAPQWRVWEDRTHVAFLTPFGNTPGFTLLVPRAHLPSDIFSISQEEYDALIAAARTVALHLVAAFDVERYGMFFEGFETDYAHVKLVPIHEQEAPTPASSLSVPLLGLLKVYPGYLSTQFGPPLENDSTSLWNDSHRLRALMEQGSHGSP